MSRYLDQFSEEKINIIPFREAGLYDLAKSGSPKVESHDCGNMVSYFKEEPERGCIDIDIDGYPMGVEMPSFKGVIPRAFLDNAKYVLRHLDDWLKLLESKGLFDKSEDHLSWIEVRKDEVEFHMAGLRVNATWEFIFIRNESGNWQL